VATCEQNVPLLKVKWSRFRGFGISGISVGYGVKGSGECYHMENVKSQDKGCKVCPDPDGILYAHRKLQSLAVWRLEVSSLMVAVHSS